MARTMRHDPLVVFPQPPLIAPGVLGPALHPTEVHRNNLVLEFNQGCPFINIESPFVTPIPGDPGRFSAPYHFVEATALQVLELSVGFGGGETLCTRMVDLPLINAAACFCRDMGMPLAAPRHVAWANMRAAPVPDEWRVELSVGVGDLRALLGGGAAAAAGRAWAVTVGIPFDSLVTPGKRSLAPAGDLLVCCGPRIGGEGRNVVFGDFVVIHSALRLLVEQRRPELAVSSNAGIAAAVGQAWSMLAPIPASLGGEPASGFGGCSDFLNVMRDRTDFASSDAAAREAFLSARLPAVMARLPSLNAVVGDMPPASALQAMKDLFHGLRLGGRSVDLLGVLSYLDEQLGTRLHFLREAGGPGALTPAERVARILEAQRRDDDLARVGTSGGGGGGGHAGGMAAVGPDGEVIAAAHSGGSDGGGAITLMSILSHFRSRPDLLAFLDYCVDEWQKNVDERDYMEVIRRIVATRSACLIMFLFGSTALPKGCQLLSRGSEMFLLALAARGTRGRYLGRALAGEGAVFVGKFEPSKRFLDLLMAGKFADLNFAFEQVRSRGGLGLLAPPHPFEGEVCSPN